METILIEKIEAYLSGEIEKSQLEKIAKEYDSVDLDNEIEWVMNAQLAIEADGLSNQLKNLLKTDTGEKGKVIEMPKKSVKGKFSALAIAAAVVLLFGVLFIFKPNNTNQLYSKYEFNDPGLPVLMSETDQHDIYDALSYYSEQNYEVTIRKLTNLKEASGDLYNDTIEYYLGVANLYQNQTKEAIPSIQLVTQDKHSIFKQRAEWIYILTSLKSNDQEKAIQLIKDLTIDTDHPFYSQAIELLSEIEK